MPDLAAERDLLFGLVALQNGLLDQAGLVAAFQAWALDRSKPIAELLAAQRAFDPAHRAAVDALVAIHLRAHDGDVARTLASLPVGPSTHRQLTLIPDPVLRAGLATLAVDTDAGARAGATLSVSSASGQPSGGRFRTLRFHDRGGLGEVFVAEDTELHREVALKQVRPHYAHDPASRQRFVAEAEITGGLEHPGIVPVYGLGAYADGRPFYAMRFIRGDNLRDAVAQFHASEDLKRDPGARSLELRKLLRRFLDVCNAIEYAHTRGVLHRDIKPHNIIVGKHGETLVVDWGLAKTLGKTDSADERPLVPSSASGSAQTLPGHAVGTPAYMSPEAARGDLESLGPRSDVYSLGATLYNVLTGRPPFEGDAGPVVQAVQRGEFPPPRRLDRSIDPALEAVCRKAMALLPDDRYASPRALADDVERWLADEPVSAWREPLRARAARWARRHRPWVVSGAALAAVVLAATAIGVRLYGRARSLEQEARARQLQAEGEARLRQYLAATGRARALRQHPRPGWTWAGLDEVDQARKVAPPSADPEELRSHVAALLTGFDARPKADLAPGVAPGCLAFSPDGRVLAVAEFKVQLWVKGSVAVVDVASGRELRRLTFLGSPGRVVTHHSQEASTCLAFSPDGRRLLLGTRSGTVYLWDWDRPGAPPPVTWPAHRDAVCRAVFGDDGAALWTGSNDGRVKRWAFAPGTAGPPAEVASWDAGEPVRDLARAGGMLWVAHGFGGAVSPRDPEGLAPRGDTVRLGYRLGVGPAGRVLAGAEGLSIRLTDVQTRRVFRTLSDRQSDPGSPPAFATLAFDPTGSLLVDCTQDDHRVRVWEALSGRLLLSIPWAGPGIGCAAFSPDGAALAVGDNKKTVLYELRGGGAAIDLGTGGARACDLAWAPDGQALACVTDSGGAFEVEVVGGASAPRVRAPLPPTPATLNRPHVAFHPGGRTLAVRGSGATFLWDVDGAGAPRPLAAEFDGALAYSPSGEWLWGLGRGEEVLAVAADTGAVSHPFRDQAGLLWGRNGMNDLAAAGGWVAAAGSDGATKLLDGRDGHLVRMWPHGDDPVRSVAVSHDGSLVASGTLGGKVLVQRPPAGTAVAALDAHLDSVEGLSFHPGGALLATGSRDGMVRLWAPLGAAEAWSPVLTLPAPGAVRRLRFSPDGSRLGAVAQDAEGVRVWDVDRFRRELADRALDWARQ